MYAEGRVNTLCRVTWKGKESVRKMLPPARRASGGTVGSGVLGPSSMSVRMQPGGQVAAAARVMRRARRRARAGRAPRGASLADLDLQHDCDHPPCRQKDGGAGRKGHRHAVAGIAFTTTVPVVVPPLCSFPSAVAVAVAANAGAVQHHVHRRSAASVIAPAVSSTSPTGSLAVQPCAAAKSEAFHPSATSNRMHAARSCKDSEELR